MAYNFTDKDIANLLNYVFNVTNGHDHDGVNSKAVTTGTPSAGSVDKTILAAGALAADATGRAVMATDFFNAATVLAKFATDSIDATNLVKLIADNAFAASAAARALFASGFFDSATIRDKFAENSIDSTTLNYLLADGAIAADANSRALIADGFFDTDTVVAKFATGALTKAALYALIPAGGFAAEANTRGFFASDFFDAATVLAKFAADSFTNANLLKLVQDGAFVADASTRALFASGFVNLAMQESTAKTHVHTYQVEDLGAGADITARSLLQVPTGFTYTLTSAKIISLGTASGIDNDNTCVVTLTDGSNTICTATYNTGTTFPAENASAAFGALDGTHKILAADEFLTLTVTNGAAANPPGFIVQVTYTMADA